METPSARKLAQNNAIFREANEKIEVAAEGFGFDRAQVAPFICECSDPRCTTIVQLTLAEYDRVRSNGRWFVHAPGHETSVAGAVELVELNPGWALVEKVGLAGELVDELATRPNSD
jgi:hypothetical protein